MTNCCETLGNFHGTSIGCMLVGKDSSWCISGVKAFSHSSEAKTPFPRLHPASRASREFEHGGGVYMKQINFSPNTVLCALCQISILNG